MERAIAGPSARVGRRFVVSVLALSLCGCAVGGRRSETPAPLRPLARDTLLLVDAARGDSATTKGFTAAAVEWLDPSVVYLRVGAPILYGIAAVQNIVGAGTPEGATFRWQPLGGGIAADGRTGYSYGVAVTATPAASETPRSPAVRFDRYLAFWRRGADGRWRIAAYSDVGGAAVPSEVPIPAPELAPSLSLPRGRRADAVRQVREADSAFALAADLQGTGIAFSSYVAPQGVVFWGSEVVTGTEAVRAVYDAQQRAGGTLNWRPVYADAADSGDLGMTVGESVFTGRGPTGAAVQRFGKYLTIWKRQPDGSWRFVVDGGNQSPTPAR